MSSHSMNNEEANAFKATVESKIEQIVDDFAKGKLSREQFQVIYERYSQQLSLAEQALVTGDMSEVYRARDAVSTIAVRDAHQGKAVGLIIYHHKSGMLVDSLGDFDVPVAMISPILNKFTLMLEENKFIDRYVEKVFDRRWVLYVPGRFATVVNLYENEPSEEQIRKMEQLHRDFEKANRANLDDETVDTAALAYPFAAFVQKKH